MQSPLPVYRQTAAVDDAAEQLRTDGNFDPALGRHHPSTGGESVSVALGHQQDPSTVEPDRFGRHQTT
jgi:hypothetical protein